MTTVCVDGVRFEAPAPVAIADGEGTVHFMEPHWRRGSWAVAACWGCDHERCSPDSALVVFVPERTTIADFNGTHFTRHNALSLALAAYQVAPHLRSVSEAPTTFTADLVGVCKELIEQRKRLAED